MPNPQNLIGHGFKPGQSGNPKGKPKGVKNRSTTAKIILDMIAKYPDNIFDKLKDQYPGLEKEMSIEEMMTIIQADKAIRKQDTQAYNAVMDSRYGKANQPIDAAINGNIHLTDEPIVFE
jgi:hypothetical protein